MSRLIDGLNLSERPFVFHCKCGCTLYECDETRKKATPKHIETSDDDSGSNPSRLQLLPATEVESILHQAGDP